ncbi:MAG: hypothetical protein JWN75_410 [Candidatus Saccharibacteria bacterium]|nr:hypothetical protein [Candidatus Saccharibacteria bacterium]
MTTKRPATALELKNVLDGKIKRIVVYSPSGEDSQEIEIVEFDEIIDRGENAILVRYKIIGDRTNTIHTNEPVSLGLSQSHDGKWYKYAIPFDE